jgi:hypothetical protein
MTTEWYRFFWNVYGFTGAGVVPVNRGGTGLNTIGDHQIIIGNANNVFEPASLSSASISITYPAGFVNLELGTSTVTPGTYGSASQVGVFTVNQYGVLTAASNTSIGIDASQIISGTIASARISGSYTGITGVGTLTAGTWNANTIGAAYGGTGQSTYTIGDLLYATGTTALSKLAIGASTYFLTSSGTAPQWTIPSSVTVGTATNLAGGLANQIPYQTGPSATTFMVAPTVANTYLEWSGTAFQWSSNPLGSVTSVSVVSANGFAGTVATATTTPAITLTTTITGLLKGNGTAISAATSGTDYAPATSGTSILYGNGAGGFSNVTIGTGVSFVAGTLSATGSGGTVTSVTGTSPVVSSGGTTPAISLATAYGDTLNPYASKTANYFLAAPNGSAGVPTFRAMVAADVPALAYVTSVSGTGSVNGITLTGTVTSSGSLTLGGTLGSIANSQLTNSTISGVALGGSLFNLTAGTGVSFSAGTTYNGSAAITINATGTGGTVTSVAALTLGTTGTDLSSTVANSTTTPVITLNVPTASAANRGALSAADWTTFNGKQAALVSGTNIKTVGGVSLLGSGDVGTIGATYGGTGQSSYAVGDILYASTTTALSKLADVATGNALISGGVGVAPSYGKIGLTTHISGTLAVGNGGTGLTSLTANYIPYGNGTGAFSSTSAFTYTSTGLGVGTGATSVIDCRVDQAATTYITVQNRLHATSLTQSVGLKLQLGDISESTKWCSINAVPVSAYESAAVLTFNTYNGATQYEVARMFNAGGMSIGNTTDPGATNLSVTGTGKFGTTVGVGAAAPAASGSGITFPATQSASTDVNTLDDYEEGTWTPVLSFGGGSVAITYTFQTGYYTKIGNTVTVQYCIFLSNKGTSTGNCLISGLPFTIANVFSKRAGAYQFADRITPNQVLTNSNATTFDLQTIPASSALSAATLTQTDFSNTTYISGTFTYLL